MCLLTFGFLSHFDWRFNEFPNCISETLLVVKKVMKTDYVWEILYGFVCPFQFNIFHALPCMVNPVLPTGNHSWLENGYNSSVSNKYIFVEHWWMIWWCGSTCPQFYESNDHYVIKLVFTENHMIHFIPDVCKDQIVPVDSHNFRLKGGRTQGSNCTSKLYFGHFFNLRLFDLMVKIKGSSEEWKLNK